MKKQFIYFHVIPMGMCNLMIVSHDVLVQCKHGNKNNMLNWRDYSMYFYNKFEYDVNR
jgi:hypothetical protein